VNRTSSRRYTLQNDVVSKELKLIDGRDGGRRRIVANGVEHETHHVNTYSIAEGDPLSARVQCDRMIQVGRGAWQVRIETVSTMTADLESFHVTNLLEAYEGDRRVFTKTSAHTYPRDHV
jgi:hypothetical protein